jgi:hypothetical protein
MAYTMLQKIVTCQSRLERIDAQLAKLTKRRTQLIHMLAQAITSAHHDELLEALESARKYLSNKDVLKDLEKSLRDAAEAEPEPESAVDLHFDASRNAKDE